MVRRRGFTLIELLVVIAIIGILAAMLFPVFARARESARKVQCLSNIKNLSMAVQMYLGDYDRFPPAETRAEVLDFFGGSDCAPGATRMGTLANPYLRWPVILEEYIKNRDVWRCASARQVGVAHIIRSGPDWFQNLKDHWWTCACDPAYPPGWGGTVTDSTVGPDCVNNASLETGSFEVDYGARETTLAGMSTSSIPDAAKYILFGEIPGKPDWWMVEHIAYPDVCRETKWALYHDCNDDPEWIANFWTDPSERKQYARHMGGDNLGFVDGHAKWYAADAILAGIGTWKDPYPSLDGAYCTCEQDSPYYH